MSRKRAGCLLEAPMKCWPVADRSEPNVLGWMPEHFCRESSPLRDYSLKYDAYSPTMYAPVQMPKELRYVEWEADVHSYFTLAEIAEVRWIEVSKASCGQGRDLAAHLRYHGFHGISFIGPVGRKVDPFAELLGNRLRAQLLARLERALSGFLFMLPLPGWSLSRAEHIRKACELELSLRASSEASHIHNLHKVGVRHDLALVAKRYQLSQQCCVGCSVLP
jgi:hypothetical protein